MHATLTPFNLLNVMNDPLFTWYFFISRFRSAATIVAARLPARTFSRAGGGSRGFACLSQVHFGSSVATVMASSCSGFQTGVPCRHTTSTTELKGSRASSEVDTGAIEGVATAKPDESEVRRAQVGPGEARASQGPYSTALQK